MINENNEAQSLIGQNQSVREGKEELGKRIIGNYLSSNTQ